MLHFPLHSGMEDRTCPSRDLPWFDAAVFLNVDESDGMLNSISTTRAPLASTVSGVLTDTSGVQRRPTIIGKLRPIVCNLLSRSSVGGNTESPVKLFIGITFHSVGRPCGLWSPTCCEGAQKVCQI